MTERSLYQPLIKGALKDGWLLYRIADGSPGRKPFDIAGSAHDNIAVGLEVKLVSELKTYDEFPWKLFAEHQMNWLKAYVEKGSYGLVAIYEAKVQRMILYKPHPKQFVYGVRVCDIPKKILTRENETFRDWRTINA